MILRVPCLALLLMCLSACAMTLKPEDSEYVSLSTALQVVARDLNQATPVVLSDVDKNGAQGLKDAIKAFQCADKIADPPLFVITGPVSLQLQGSVQRQMQAGGQAGFPLAAQFSFQVQKTKAQQQQLTIPITFVAASALPDFFLGQNLTNVSTLPDLPDPKDPSKADVKGTPPKGSGDGTRSSSDNASPACVNTSCDKVTLGQDKARLQLMLISKSNAIRDAVTDQIAAVTDHSGAYAPPKDYCPKDQGVNFVLPAISVVLPQALRNL
jgi:hypothetical protein